MPHSNNRRKEIKMYDYSNLIGKIIGKFGTRKNFARAMRTQVSTVSQLLNDKRHFSQRTIDKWAAILDIPYDEIGIYFFKKKVGERQVG